MFLQKYTYLKLNYLINKYYLLLNIFFFFLVLFSNQVYFIQISFYLYLAITTILIRNKQYLSNGLSMLYNFFTIFLINLPLSFNIFLNNFPDGSSPNLYNDQLFYINNLSSIILKLFFYWILIWFSIYISTNVKTFNNLKTYSTKNYLINPILLFIVCLLYLIIIILTFKFADKYNLIVLRNLEIARFFFSDEIIISYLLVIFIYLINFYNKSYYNLISLFELVILLLLTALIITTTKAALFKIVIFYFASIAALKAYTHPLKKKVLYFLFPNIFVLIFAICFSIFIYALIYENRNYVEFNPTEIFFNFNIIFYTEHALNRISDQFLSPFILINMSYAEYDLDYALKFGVYIIKRIINLLAYGTIYQEAYLPSSQLFESILNKEDLIGFGNKIDLSRDLNTKPFTGFGIFKILFGPFGAFFLFIYYSLISLLFWKINGIFLRLNLALLFFKTLICFSIEEIISEFIFFYIIIIFLHFSLNFFQKLLLKINLR